MADEPENGAKAELAGQILTIVSETFALQRRVVLLSYLGQALSKRGLDFRQILGEQKLAEFIKERLGDQIRIVPTPAGRLVLAAVPIEVVLENEIDPFGLSRRAPAEGGHSFATQQKRELLVRDAWFAFSHSLESGKARVLRLEPHIEYQDYDPNSGDKPQGYDVPPDMIVPLGSFSKGKRDELIYENVRAWAAQNDVPFRALIETHASGARRNSLDVILSSLSDSDLSRITMPLDLVAKLRRKQN
jgi:hypothetical protein